MSDLSALVVDDEWIARNYLVELVRETGLFTGITAVTSAAEALYVMDTLKPDVAFVDIRLVDRAGDTSGLELAQTMSSRACSPAVVLATASSDHALDAFDFGAVDYLLKPFTAERVRQCVERVQRRRSTRSPTSTPRLVARDQSGLLLLEFSGVRAFEASDRLAYVHHIQGKYFVDLSLRGMESALGSTVMRVHRSWLIVPGQVRAMERVDGDLWLVLDGALRVPVTREKAREVRDQLLAGTIGLRPSGR
ncbi:MAG: LytTR family DNA-binding domain-containing protein [Myxococcota bacterium]